MSRAEDLALQPDDECCRDNEHRSEHGARADRIETAAALMNALIDQRWDIIDAVLDAEDGHRAEMRHRIEHDEKRPRENTRQNERDRDLSRDRKEPRARDARRLLEGRIHALKGAAHLNEDEREKVHDLHAADPIVGVDVEDGAREAEMIDKELIDKAGIRREQHLPRECTDKGRQHKGDEEHSFHEGLVRQIRPRDKPREERPDDRTAHRGAGSNDEGVEQSLIRLRLLEDIQRARKVERSVHPECVEENQQNWEGYHNDQNGNGKKQDHLRHTKALRTTHSTHLPTSSFS